MELETEIILRKCGKCEIEKPFTKDFFLLNKTAKSGLGSMCKICDNIRRKKCTQEIKNKNIKEEIQYNDKILKQCLCCQEFKPLSPQNFYRNNLTKGGFSRYCRNCEKNNKLELIKLTQNREWGESKICHDCKFTLPRTTEYFNKSPWRGDGFTSHCKKCISKQKKSLAENKQKNILNGLLDIPKEQKCNICQLTYSLTKDFFHINKHLNLGFSLTCKMCSRICSRKYSTEWRKKQRLNPRFRLDKNISTGIRDDLQRRGKSKNKRHWEDLVGYSSQDLRERLESQFVEGMSWDTYKKDGWAIDHIIPKSAFDYLDYNDEMFKICWSLVNLQPMWADANLEKNDFLPNGKRVTESTEEEINFYINQLKEKINGR